MRIRDATGADVPEVNRLYNVLIPTTTIAWTDDPMPLVEHERWFAEQQRSGDPVLVAVDADDEVIGYTSYGDFRDTRRWPGYRYVAELTLHVAESHWGRGVGRALLEALIDRATDAGKHVLVAGVDGENEASIRLHEKLGFVVTARMPEVGRKFDRWLDLVYLQLILEP